MVQTMDMMRIISEYRITQDNIFQTGGSTSCKQQMMSLFEREVAKPNPNNNACLNELGKCIGNRRAKGPTHKVILMSDMNNYREGGVYDFFLEKNLIHLIFLLKPDSKEDHIYVWGSKRFDYKCMSSALAKVVLKDIHHQFYWHFITDQKGVCLESPFVSLFLI